MSLQQTVSLAPEHGSVFFQHVLLGERARWRCDWRGRGVGTVVAKVELLGSATGYDVVLDDGAGEPERALPGELRLLPAAQDVRLRGFA